MHDHADVAVGMMAAHLVIERQRVGQDRRLRWLAVAGAVTAVGDQVDGAVGEPVGERLPP